jgi:hypothetical protein
VVGCVPYCGEAATNLLQEDVPLVAMVLLPRFTP